MTTDYTTAIEGMKERFYTDWTAGTTTICGYIPDVRWQKQATSDPPPSDKIWARWSVQSVLESQTNVSVSDEFGRRRYTGSGLVFVQLFIPQSLPNADLICNQLAVLARNAYRGKVAADGCVWFRNARINTLDPENVWFRSNVVAEYEYDEIA